MTQSRLGTHSSAGVEQPYRMASEMPSGPELHCNTEYSGLQLSDVLTAQQERTHPGKPCTFMSLCHSDMTAMGSGGPTLV